jgi:hypothetical protein
MALDNEMLTEYMEKFYGYGSYRGQYWFVGKEEGGGKTQEENLSRILKWDKRGRPEVDDITGDGQHIHASRYFGTKAKIQKTWGKLIRVLLAVDRDAVTTHDVREYQRHKLGRENGQTCLLELLPLPSPSTGTWIWRAQETLPQLQSRELYKTHYARTRAQHIAARLAEYQPSVVVFYSTDWWYRQWWHLIAGVRFSEVVSSFGSFYTSRNEHTIFVIMQHPTAWGLKNEYFDAAGYYIRAELHNQAQI